MQILNSGSFISLENEEKIEQLKFTASELATATIESPGFVNDEAKNRTLALDLWNGLEYMCRDHEEAAIKNVFNNRFLEHLREVRLPIAVPLPPAESMQEENHVENHEENQDEFLGHLENSEGAERSIEEPKSEPIPEENNVEVEPEVSEDDTDSFSDVELNEEDTAIVTSSEGLCDDVDIESADQVNSVVETPIAMPEKEPYQFDKCTVMIAMQLLPVGESGNFRRAVLSVRTHDFPPQISLVSVPVDDLQQQISIELGNAMSRYQADLPIKVMDKMRLEKNGAKKTPPAPTTAKQTASVVTQHQNPAIAPKQAERSQQGSLFG